MRSYEIYSSKNGKMQFELKIKDEEKADAWINEFENLNPGAFAWKEARNDVSMRLPTWAVYTRIDCRLKFRGHVAGESAADVLVEELKERYPGAEVWCAPMCPHDDPALI